MRVGLKLWEPANSLLIFMVEEAAKTFSIAGRCGLPLMEERAASTASTTRSGVLGHTIDK
jgi:hypothetical protein